MAQAVKKKKSAPQRVRKHTVQASKSGRSAGAGKAAAKKTTSNTTRARSTGTPRGATRRTEIDASKPRSVAATHLYRALREAAGIACLLGALIFALALFTFSPNDPGWSHTGANTSVVNSVGPAGAWVADVFLSLFGYIAYLVPIMIAYTGWRLLRGGRDDGGGYEPFAFVRITGFALLLIAASGLADLHFAVPVGALPHNTFGGGWLGTATAWKLVAIFKPLGTTLLLIALFFCALTLAIGSSWMQLIEQTGALVMDTFERLSGPSRRVIDGFREDGKRRAAARTRRVRAREMRLHETDLDVADEVPAAAPKRRKRRGASTTDAEPERVSKLTPQRGGLGKLAEYAREVTDQARAAATVKRDGLAPDGPAGALDDTLAADDASIPTLDKPVLKPAGGTKAKRAAAATAPAVAAPPVSPGSAPPAAPAAPAPPKPAIKKRSREEQQFALFNDVPDSDLPPLSLLDPPQQSKIGYTQDELEAMSRLLEVKLAEFNITVEVESVHPGPVITRFELQPAPGLKARQITNLTQDIARSLSLVSVRVVEVIAGKSTIGLEIPNAERELVQLSEIFQSDNYEKQKSPLTLALGKDISGGPVVADLARMPHLLVAGTTGSGKSVAVNAMLLSLLYKATPKQVRMILIDPKMLELNIYDGIPHLLAPVVTDMKEASNALRWCVGEMERRYRLMASLGVRHLAGYNRKVEEAIAAGKPIPDPTWQPELSIDPGGPPPTLEPFPCIVVVVDEFADMIMQVGKKAEELIARIAQKARAAGIHLILATQRPSVDVITGLIKANVPARIAFQVSSKIDSRTILDQMGAESLLGNGDMLYLPPGMSIPERVHGAFVDDHEVHNVTAHLKQSGEPNYLDEILQESGPLPGIPGDKPDAEGEQDALYDEAVAIVTESRKASISYVQRRLKIGYNRAARIIETMEAAGVVSTVNGNGTREVLAPPPVGS